MGSAAVTDVRQTGFSLASPERIVWRSSPFDAQFPAGVDHRWGKRQVRMTKKEPRQESRLFIIAGFGGLFEWRVVLVRKCGASRCIRYEDARQSRIERRSNLSLRTRNRERNYTCIVERPGASRRRSDG